jgi:hypothetical protein
MLFAATQFLSVSSAKSSLHVDGKTPNSFPAPLPYTDLLYYFFFVIVSVRHTTSEHQDINIPPLPSSPSSLSSLPSSKLNLLNTQLRLSKMFSKSLQQPDNVRPFWFTASEPPTPIGITTILTLDDMEYLDTIATYWKGKVEDEEENEDDDEGWG